MKSNLSRVLFAEIVLILATLNLGVAVGMMLSRMSSPYAENIIQNSTRSVSFVLLFGTIGLNLIWTLSDGKLKPSSDGKGL